jgi:predicted DsbA family dithiol-disulfide isomerase
MADEKPKVAVDIWSDVVCPWCAIGLTQFRKALDQLEDEIEVELRFMPFELEPREVELREHSEVIAENYGKSIAEVEEMFDNLRDVGRKVGFSFEWEGEGDPPPLMAWNTFEVHKLLRWALTTQGMEAQLALKLALLRAHFQQRRRIGDRQVLLDIAENLGFDRKEAEAAMEDEALAIAVRMEQKRGIDADIKAVPSFVINGRYLIPGAQEPEAFAGFLRQVVANAA